MGEVGNSRMSMNIRASTMKLNSRADIRASVAAGRKSIMGMGIPSERKPSCIPEDANTFEELFSNLD